ncbi:hypothetical protein B0H67DRAFT_551681 [Lasiosphaeris hirsuta]|uniref:Uncharacterized protein n=1 Tax=Lasiosphaeris hirsuta TaxID=260670 RepID=A0AA40ANV8_9PEZI|nr:hypothetical protein B0H67DRAFT_551681 [Lasiosphaeris hirsuta]
MLSKRILLFSTFQPYWICRRAADSGGDLSPAGFLTALDLDTVIAPPPPLGHDNPADFGHPWPWVAENYSLRVLSDPADKQLAIHAVQTRYRAHECSDVAVWDIPLGGGTAWI